ncbi:MAG: 5-formyltetrahydrofolate cyclo-ligase, partial [Coriobacteriia bacterium]|nr:5-formyltetrahydrofolate cyclo-ligase [Coriobacteriia bacterium]
PFGLLEPPEDSPVVPPEDIDIVIVPGVAFDVACWRVGHGGGYYDRLLGMMGRAVAVGLAFDGQVFAEVPHDDNDVRLDALVTPSRTLRRERP